MNVDTVLKWMDDEKEAEAREMLKDKTREQLLEILVKLYRRL